MKKTLWKFIDDKGTFISESARQINALYFPLCNSYPLMSSISPSLRGDIKTGLNSFLMEPVSRIDLSNSKSSRNFWIYINPKKIWSAAGVAKDIRQLKEDKFHLEAGLLWHKVSRQNKKIGLKSQITSFIPASGEPVEIMRVELTNISNKAVKFIPAAAIPIFARSAHNLRDHRHVTSLLNRVQKEKIGLSVTPTLLFDESGHKKNQNTYFVFGFDEKYKSGPQYIYPAQEEFTGEGCDLEAPCAVFDNLLPAKKYLQGKEAMAGLRFKANLLKPKQSASYIILMGITGEKAALKTLAEKFNTTSKLEESLKETKAYWQAKSSQISVNTGEGNFDNWLSG